MALSTVLTNLFVGFAKRHPFLAGIPLIVLGTWLAWYSLKLGAEYDPFIGTTPIEAEVVTANDDPARSPRYAADVTWTTKCSPQQMAAAGAPSRKKRRMASVLDELCVDTHRALVEISKQMLPDPKAINPESRLRPGSRLRILVSRSQPEVAIREDLISDLGIFTLGGRNIDARALAIGGFAALLGIAIVVLRERLG